MATKTISIDLEAYERLRNVKQASESFSETIKRVVRPTLDVDAWLRQVREHPLSDAAVAAVEEQVARRSRPSRRER